MRNMYKLALGFLTLSISPQMRHFVNTPQPIPATPLEEPNNFLTEAEIYDFRTKKFSPGSVTIDPEYKDYLRKVGKQHQVQWFEKQCVEKTREAVLLSAVTKIRRKAMLGGLTFFVRPPPDLGYQNGASFDGYQKRAYIHCSSDSTPATLKSAVDNEMFHAQIRERNSALGITKSEDHVLSEPFCDLHGKVNATQANQLIEAVEADFQKLLRFHTVLMGKHFSWGWFWGYVYAYAYPTEEALYAQAVEVLGEYQPPNKTFFMNKNTFLQQRLTQTGDPKFYRAQNLQLENGKQVVRVSRISYEEKGKVLKVKNDYPEIMSKLVRAMAFLEAEIFTVEEMKAHPGYSTRSAEKFASERASNMEHLPSAIKEFFFENTCRFFSEFHAVGEYCQDEEKSQIPAPLEPPRPYPKN
jgi:hypothetical protein